ncbi:transcription factor IIA subunit alpha [Malassezia arunalokei]|uniref:Transcription initiation factor IIA large subunit n=1 Tax=Malassezia arunalokei TaxID=1514897 RepID=A0AAJ5YXN8_9BASI|nr:transcription factor IIA subunit alpha [Malassezia arunalokei]
MSNRVVSATFRHIIDDVITNVRQDFEDMGIEKEVLEELQRSWEAKLVATQVAEFDGAAGQPTPRGIYDVDARQDGVSVVPPVPAAPIKAEQESHQVKPEDEHNASQKRKRDPSDEGKRESDQDDDAHKDEIGSDLDDSDDDDGDGSEDMILCLYDKVQRVKNKWKCVLRDGVASIGGRDYLFSKCNGEFEW